MTLFSDRITWGLVGILLMFIGTVYIIYSYYTPQIDSLALLLTVYIYLITLLAEKKLYLPPKILRIYDTWWFNKIVLLLYIPGAYMMFILGYNYGGGLEFTKMFISVVYSVLVGLVIVTILYFINEIIKRRWGV